MATVLTRRQVLRRAALLSLSGATGSLLEACDVASTRAPARSPSPTRSSEPALSVEARFPEDFAWGAATSAYQIEGAATEGGRGPSIWDTFARTPGAIRDGSTGDVAADHYHRYEEDLDLMSELGLRSYRFSISWPRIQPEGSGAPNQQGIDFYRRLVDGLNERAITPVATLFHWDLPQALQDAGGWESRDVALRFAEYADVVFRALGDAVPTWLTLNEPKTVVEVGYIFGGHAPGKRDPAAAYVAAHHMLLAHGLAVQAKRAAGGGRIGPALNLAPVYPVDEARETRRAATLRDGFENRLYLDPILLGSYPEDVLEEVDLVSPMPSRIQPGDLATISEPIDVLGVQYYTPITVDRFGDRVFTLPTSQALWQEIHPEGLYDILVRVREDYGDVPVVITENGIPVVAEPDEEDRIEDAARIAFLHDHLSAAHRAISEGVRLEGYHLWSLLDNFEWAEGYTQRWGIVHVDFETQRRTPKDSAHWYRDVVGAGGLIGTG